MTVVTRFAPSPTGMLHIGNARTALYNWLLARHSNGKFILRVEDTDRERSTKENVQVILEGMKYLGLDFDEGPFFQSERSEIYQAAIDRMLDEGKAYRCRCTPEELDAKRAAAVAEKRTYLYDGAGREKNYGPEQPHVVRLKMPTEGVSAFHDQIMGDVESGYVELDDWIIARTDGTPTYNFCVVVDDSDMGVTLVVRGADHLVNTHKQIPLYRALDLTPPDFGHMPLTLGKDRSKLSKRDGAVSLLEYLEMGYLPEAMRNFLARLGWAHGDQELFTDEELIAAFDLSGVGKSNSIFDNDKLDWINSMKIKERRPEDLVDDLLPFLKTRNFPAEGDPRLPAIIAQLQERSKTLLDMAEQAAIFFVAPTEYAPKALKKWWKEGSPDIVRRYLEWLRSLDELRQEDVMPFAQSLAAELEVGLGKAAQPLRIALTGSSASPPLDATLYLIGKDEAIARLEKALAELA
ncbi:MAG: glutamate--tRNA ligase [Candidatus Lernaella stagnicola]|nr:glutamate--tRNA ligase [Candidatus Lernaella stagnicola]